METLSAIAINGATRTDLGTSRQRSALRWFADMMDVAAKVWPKKTACHLAAQTKVSPRAAEFWLAGTYDMKLEKARELLRSEHGFEFLTALIGDDCDARWWKRIKLNSAHAEMGRKLRAHQKRLDELRRMRDQIDLEIDPHDED